MKINKSLSHKALWFDSMIGMSWGFFSTLIIGTIIGLIGMYSKDNIFLDVKKVLSYITPFAIGIGIGVKTKSEPLQILSIGLIAFIAGQSLLIPHYVSGSIDWTNVKIGISTKFLSGDVFAAWISSVTLVYVFNIFKWKTNFDILIIPMLGCMLGILNSIYLTYITSTITVLLEWVIDHSINNALWIAILLAPIGGAMMGLALTFPISSAAMAFAMNLDGNAAIIAIAGTSAQMISFGVITYMGTKSLSQAFAVGFGTSMLQINNYMNKPILLVIPTIASAVTAIVSVGAFGNHLPFEAGSVTSGMGTCALYGQIYALKENGWTDMFAWLNVVFMQLLLPFVITLPLWMLFENKKWIKGEWLNIWNNTQQNTLTKQNK